MSKLVARTRELLADRPRSITYAHIEAETGVKVRWLETFAAGQAEHPSCVNVELVYNLLAGKNLDV